MRRGAVMISGAPSIQSLGEAAAGSGCLRHKRQAHVSLNYLQTQSFHCGEHLLRALEKLPVALCVLGISARLITGSGTFMLVREYLRSQRGRPSQRATTAAAGRVAPSP